MNMQGNSGAPQRRSFLYRAWRIARWPLGALVLIYVGLVIYRVYAIGEEEKTAQTVAAIHGQKLTLDDVMGKNLPPQPDPALVDATVEGIDANGNGIRDDVELAIFKKYPDSARIRAAELQYAMALQNELTRVFNSETLVAAIQQEGRGSVCLLDSEKADDLSELVFNTETRKNLRNQLYEKFMTSYALPNSNFCDVDVKSLIN